MDNTQNTRRLVLKVPEEFHHELKVAAATRRQDMRDLVVECVSNCLKSNPDPVLKAGTARTAETPPE